MARTIKRKRRTNAEVEAIEAALIAIAADGAPQSVRHVFYRMVSDHPEMIEKSQAGYRTVQRKLVELRRSGKVEWRHIADGTRWRVHGSSFGSPAEIVRAAARTYRRDLWRRAPVYVEVWVESDSMASTINGPCNQYNVPLLSSRGFASASFLYSSAMEIREEKRPAYLYYVGDWDPAGVLIPEKIEQGIREHAPETEVHFERLLVTPEQIESWALPTRPPKKTTHARNFQGGTVEAEAVPAEQTRAIVRAAIERHIDRRELRVLLEAEKSERQMLEGLARSMH